LRGDGLDVTGDWMTTLLQTKAFHRIPPANIQAIFMRMQRINYRLGDVVIKQGTEGDYFYVVVRGMRGDARDAAESSPGYSPAGYGERPWSATVVVIQSPVTSRPSPRNSATSYWPVWSQVNSTSSKSLSIMMYSRSTAARAVNFRGRPGASAARACGVPARIVPMSPIVRPKFDVAGHQIESALVGIAFLE